MDETAENVAEALARELDALRDERRAVEADMDILRTVIDHKKEEYSELGDEYADLSQKIERMEAEYKDAERAADYAARGVTPDSDDPAQIDALGEDG